MHSHVTYIIGSTEVGGAETQLLRICNELRHQSWDIDIFCLSDKGALSPQFKAIGCSVHHPFKPPFLRPFFKPVQILHAILIILWHFVTKRPRLVHFFLPAAYLIAGPLAILCRIPHKIMSRRSRNHYQSKHILSKFVEKKLHHHMEHLLANAEIVKKDLISEGAPYNHITVLYNGIDYKKYRKNDNTRQNIRKQLQLSSDDILIICVANIIPYKGHMDLLQGLAAVHEFLPKNWKLALVGYQTSYYAKITQAIKALGLEDHVLFLGQRQDVADLLQGADIGTLCSHEEGFSNTILEYVASGLPILATTVGGNSEIIAHGVNGYLVPPHRPKEIGKALLDLIENPEVSRKMGKTNQDNIAPQFGINQAGKDLIKLYKGLMGASNTLCK